MNLIEKAIQRTMIKIKDHDRKIRMFADVGMTVPMLKHVYHLNEDLKYLDSCIKVLHRGLINKGEKSCK